VLGGVPSSYFYIVAVHHFNDMGNIFWKHFSEKNENLCQKNCYIVDGRELQTMSRHVYDLFQMPGFNSELVTYSHQFER
jgi:hypothetical protein